MTPRSVTWHLASFTFAAFPWPDLGRTGFLDGVTAGWEAPAEVDKLAWDLR
jgi:hypothetical protein